MISLDDVIKGLFGTAFVGIVLYVASWVKSVRVQQAQNERDHIELDISKIKDKYSNTPIDELIADENGQLRRRRLEHKTPKRE